MTQVDEGPESLRTPEVLTVAPQVGEILADRYRLEAHVGDDAFGRQVWRGLDVLLRRPVAVVLRQPGGQAAAEMLEAAVKASRVGNPHLVDIYDAIDEGGKAYVVREWVDGHSLRDVVSDAPMEPDRATSVVHAISSAVAAFHAAGLAHGNIHPGTVMLGDDGQVLLTDARADDSASPDADVRAIGAVLYAALTGHWPHREAGRAALPDALREVDGALIAPRRIRGGVPSHLSDLATDLLDGQLAPPSADVLAADLGRLDAEQEDVLLDNGEVFLGGGFLGSSARLEPRRSVGPKLAVGVAGLLVLAIVGILIGTTVLTGGGSSGAGTTPQPSTSQANNPKTTVLPLSADALRLVSPNGQRDNAKDLGKAVDGDTTSAWETDHYDTSSVYFTTNKKGLGLVIDLGAVRSVSEVAVDFTHPGASAALYTCPVAAPPSGSPTGDQAFISQCKQEGDPAPMGATHRFILSPDDANTRYVMIYITALPLSIDQPGRYQVGISEIKVSVNQ